MNVLRFLKWLQERGWDVRLYAHSEARMFTQAAVWGIEAQAINAHRRYGDFLNAWRLARRLRHDGVRLLVIHRSQDMFLGVFARLFAGKKVRLIYSQHMHIGGTKKDFFHSWLYSQFDAWATPVPWLADRVKEKTTIPPEKIHVVTRGLETDKFTAGQPDKSEARRRYNLPTEALIIGLIGRLDPKKCQDVLIRALARLHTTGHRAHILFVGDQTFDEADEYAQEIKRLVRELGLSEYVHFRPHDDQVHHAYAALDIFVLASKSECYGMVTIEAMTSGLPVVGTSDGGTLSIIRSEENGLLVRPKNVDDLTAALLRLIENPELAARLGKTAREEALVKYSHTRQCESWEKLIREVGC